MRSLLAFVVLAGAAAAQARPAAQILRDYDGVAYPSMSEGSDPESIARFTRQIEEAAAKQEALALELRKGHTDHPRVPELMTRRWTLLCTVQHDGRRVLDETRPYVELGPVRSMASEELRRAAASARGRAALESDLPFAEQRALIEQALAAAPGDESAGCSLGDLLKYRTADPAIQRELLARFEKELAHLEWAGDSIRKLRGLVDRLGSEVALDFQDAANRGSGGLPRSTRELRGRPLLLHFASYPGSDGIEKEAATLAALREQFGPRGLAVVSIHQLASEEPLAERKAKLAELGFTGPQYVDLEPFGGNLLASELDQSETPLLLLLDGEGKLQAFCFRAEPMKPLLERVIGASGARPPRKRAI